MQSFTWMLVLLVSAVLLTAGARRLKLPYPSLLALGGVAIALLPNLPEFHVEPELMLALFVAPVLLDAAFDTSLRDLKRMWVPVTSLVVIAVGVTTFAVAWLARKLVPDMPWAAAIALGAIVAPPDAAAASAVLRHLHIPHRMLVILEGESLLNDATALLVYRLAVAAAMGTATFTPGAAGMQGLAMIASVAAGFVLAQLSVRMLRLITDIPSAIVLQFATTFGVWILAEEVGLSAIVTIVTYAITAARLAPGQTPARVRLPAYAVWETVVFVLNVLAFVLIGLQVRPIFESLEPFERTHYLQIAAAVLGMVVAVRIVWVFTYNRIVWAKVKLFGAGVWPGEFQPKLASSTVVSWCGMRGIVTLAAAYALPVNFPYRDLILLCAFSVVVGTLIVQGLTLRPLIRALKITADDTVDDEVRRAQEQLVKVAHGILDDDGSTTAAVLRDEFAFTEDDGDGAPAGTERDARNHLRGRIVAAQREALVRMRETAEIGDDAFHRVEERLDWAEVNVR
jgi:CPA1 family monovalent cation:H+ antiporter